MTLSEKSIAILRSVENLAETTGDLVFPGHRGKPLSDMVFTAMLRRLDIPAVCSRFPKQFQGLVHRMHRTSVGRWGKRLWRTTLGIQPNKPTPGRTCLNIVAH